MTRQWAIEATGLEKSYGAVKVLTGVDIQVAKGSVFSLLGPNGAGKTTTVRILATLMRADAGKCAAGSASPASTRRWTKSRPAKRTCA